MGLRRVLGDDFETPSYRGEGDCTALRRILGVILGLRRVLGDNFGASEGTWR